ncbi:MAG: HD domain-containing protein [Blautia sp.]
MDLKYANREFQKFLDEYDREDEKVNLKIVHTEGVVKCADEIAVRMGVSEEDRALADMIALLHDIGRFEQLKLFDSFQPDTMDHAAYGVQLLFGPKKMIRRFVQEDTWDEIIETAIAKHSDFRLKGIVDDRTLLHARLIRDADKLDNCRVKLEESIEVLLGVGAEDAGKQEITEKIWDTCMKKSSILSADRVTAMDYWISYLAYFFDINFPATFSIIKEQDYVQKLINRIPYENQDTGKKMKFLCDVLQEYINEMVG